MFHRVKPETQQPSVDTNVKPQEEADEISEKEIEEAQETEQTEETIYQAEENNMPQDITTEVNETQEAQTSTSAAGNYQRTPAQNYAASYAPAPSYNAPSAPAASAPAPVSEKSSASAGERRLTIGAGITMSGEIESCDYLLVEGTVEAALKGATTLDISESGTFYGTVEIGEATVAGRFEGDITVHGRLLIRTGGVITGTIAYGELEVETGAVIDGRLTPVAASGQATGSKPKVKPAAPTGRAPTKEDKAEPANAGEGELFSKAS